MKNAELKPHRHLENKSRDYLLTLTLDGVARKIVWNDNTPLDLDHPKGWTLAKINEVISIYDSTEHNLEKRIATTVTLPLNKKDKTTLTLPSPVNGKRRATLTLSINPLTPLQPPYKQVGVDGHTNTQAPLQLLMYHGIRYFLLKYRPVGGKLTAKSGQEQIFSYSRSPQGFTVTALTTNISIKTKGKKQPLPVGAPRLIPDSEFYSSVIIHGIYWWRFRAVISPNALSPLEEDETEDEERENRRFRITTQSVVAFLMVLFCGAYAYNYLYPKKPEPVITKVELKAPKVIPHKIAEIKPTPTPVPIPEPVKKEVVKKEPPKKQKPEKVVKKEPVKPKKVAKAKPAPKAPVKKAPPVKQVAKKAPVKEVQKPKKIAAPQVAAKPAPVAAPPAPVHKAKENSPKPGVVAKKSEAPPAPDENAQVLKSLSFLSSGSKNPKKGGVAKYDKAAKKDFMTAPALGGGSIDSSNVLDKLSASSGDTNIKTKSSRTIAADTGFGSPKGKGLNDVQGKVSLTELYSGGGSGGGFSEGVGISISGPGELSEGEIEKALAKYIARFQFCYEKSLLSDSTLSGNIRLQWTITTSGKANDTKVLNSQLNNEALHRCIVKVLKDIPFPRPKDGPVTAKKTFSFKSTAL